MQPILHIVELTAEIAKKCYMNFQNAYLQYHITIKNLPLFIYILA